MHQHHAGHQHLHNAEIEKRQQETVGGTVVQYVYKTADPTFDGPIGGYVTEGAPTTEATPTPTPTAESTPDASPQANANSNSNANSDSQAKQQAAQQAAAFSSSQEAAAASAATTTPTADEAVNTNTATSTSSTEQQVQTSSTSENTQSAAQEATSSSSSDTATPSVTAAAKSSSAASPSSTSSYISSTSSAVSSHTAAASHGSSGMSSGAKAGLAIGILLAIGALIGVLFFCYRRRRKVQNDAFAKVDDEKSAYAGGLARAQSTASTRTTATAPRLSLRPVTEFLPDLAARGKNANAAAVAKGAAREAPGGPVTKSNEDAANPFGDHAEKSERSSLGEKQILPIQANTPENPFTDNAGSVPPANDPDAPAPLRIKTPTPEAVAAAGAGAAGVVAGGAAGAKLAERHNAPKPLNLTPNRPVSPAASSPAVSEFSQTPISPGAFANGPPPSNVHRIQLDFKPSMDDELSLRAGQLVRLLHEYDDGWALCIRLDRSQQGVAPRTCLSARPVKPRPPPGARGPGPRGPPPPGMMGPGQQRPASPASGRGSPSPYGRAPRAMAPGPAGSQQRSMSPGPYGGGPQRPANIAPPGSKRRSNSAGDVRERRNSPPGPSSLNPNVQRVPMQLQAVTSPDQALSQQPPQSTMARKPVPGQAM